MLGPRVVLAALAALAVSYGPSATAAARYLVGVEQLSYLPHYAVEAGEYRGYAREVLDAFAADRAIVFEYRPLPVKRLFRLLVQGGIDFKYPDRPEWNVGAKLGVPVTYSTAVAPFVDGVMVRPERIDAPAQPLQRLGTVKGFTPWAWNDRLESGAVDLWENPSLPGLLRQTIAGRVDGAYINTAVARYFLEHSLHRPGALAFDPRLPHDSSSYQMSSSRHPRLIEAFNRWLATHAERVQALQRKWGVID